MELPGFPHKGPEDKSYVAANDMLKYLEDYADYFDLKKHVKVNKTAKHGPTPKKGIPKLILCMF